MEPANRKKERRFRNDLFALLLGATAPKIMLPDMKAIWKDRSLYRTVTIPNNAASYF